MKKNVLALIMALMLLLGMTSCSIPIISDFIESEDSLGKTNNTAVAIAAAMKDYLKNKKADDLSLYGIEMILNSDGNGNVKLYYAEGSPDQVDYSDIRVAEVDSKTGHVERFSKADYAKDGIAPYQTVRDCNAFDAGTLPIDSQKAISLGIRAFSSDSEFHYDYVQLSLTSPGDLEQYEIRFISMLNDTVYTCKVDAVNGAVLSSAVNALEEGK